MFRLGSILVVHVATRPAQSSSFMCASPPDREGAGMDLAHLTSNSLNLHSNLFDKLRINHKKK